MMTLKDIIDEIVFSLFSPLCHVKWLESLVLLQEDCPGAWME